jgi:hypothetical protein
VAFVSLAVMVDMGLNLRPRSHCKLFLDFLMSNELDAITATGGAMSQVAAANGAMRLATDANDNTQCSAQFDAAVVLLKQGTFTFEALFAAVTDVDNMDLGIGLVTTDTDWLGDAATANEYIYVGFADAGSSDGEIELTLYWKNASGSGSQVLKRTMKEGSSYFFGLEITIDAEGVCTAKVKMTQTSGTITPTTVAADEQTVTIPHYPVALVNPSVAIQNGAAAAQTWDIDYVDIEWQRYVG